jgi:hypothetical protein
LRAALAVMVGMLVVAGVASAREPVYTLVKADTLTKHCADSSSVYDVSAYDVMSLEFVVTPGKLPSGVVQAADTLVELLVSAREHLPARMLSTTAAATYATASDSTLVEWLPRYGWIAGSQTDTISVNNVSPAATAAGSHEIRVWVRPATKNVNGVLQRRVTTLDLINTSTGMPFSAKWASFKWRLASGPSVANVRVVLKGKTF